MSLFHYAVRKAKRLANKMNADALVAAAAEGDIALFEEIKKYLHRKTDEQRVPNTLEGKVTHSDILDKFKECYETLYNSASTNEELNKVKSDIEELIRLNTSIAHLEVDKITPEAVKLAACRMKEGKSDVSQEYSSQVC